MEKKYVARRCGVEFYADSLKELANDVKSKYPTVKTFYPAEFHPLYRVYVAMNYYGYDINTLEKKHSPKKKKKEVNKKLMMSLPADDLETLLIHTIKYTSVYTPSYESLRLILTKIYNGLPEDRRKEIEDRYPILLNTWILKED